MSTHAPKRSLIDRDLTTGEAAKFMRMSIQSVIRAVDTGTIKGYRLPGSLCRRVPASSVRRWLEENELPVPEELAAGGKD